MEEIEKQAENVVAVVKRKRPKPLSDKPRDVKILMCQELVALGAGNKEICEKVGISECSLWTYKREPGFYDAVREKHLIIFKDLVPKALKTIEAALESENSKVKFDAARLILDRNLFPESMGSNLEPPSQGTTVNIQVNYE
jgi:hypothetical protein